MKKLLVIILICALIIIPQTGCGKEEQVSSEGFYLDTICNITIYNIEKKKGEKLTKGALKVCDKYEKMMSKTVDGSDVDRINKAGGKPVKVSRDTLDVIKLGLEMSRDSGGKFDITVGRITDLWDFKSKNPKVPAADDIRAAVATVGYKQVKIKGNTVQLTNPETKIDLGAVAKGYIADRVTDYLKKNHVDQAIINLGGNVVAIGSKSKGTPWRVGIEKPFSGRSKIVGATPATNEAVVTSGIYEREFKKNGRIYHHIIDPSTGYPVDNDVVSDTIVARAGRAARCDGYSTVCLLLGVDKGKKFIEKQKGFQALFIDRDNKITKTKGMKFEKSEDN
ncbi:MAG: FAD:protein FMN transferase [Anaerovoracaceae bacterium]|jgi:thiamine biosynthesis lipoprotein